MHGFYRTRQKKAGKIQPIRIKYSDLNIDNFWGLNVLEVNAIVLVGSGRPTQFVSSSLVKNEDFC